MKPLRILMMIHAHWTPDLGAPQAQMELTTIFRQLGHQVTKFSHEDAFPHRGTAAAGVRMARLIEILKTNQSFARRAKQYLRRVADRFDIIDANQTDIPFAKESFGFSGLLVARSVGLIPLYDEFDTWARRRWPAQMSAREQFKATLTAPARRRWNRDVFRSFRYADLVNVSNSDELRYVSDVLGLASKCVHIPLGISDERRDALLAARAGASEKLAAQRVVAIGSWNARKGAFDWPEIVRRVRAKRADARFLFLGTSIPSAHVIESFSPEDRAVIEAVQQYGNQSLPARLSDATVGAFPGYLEGFGLGVLEMLAAGLPTVGYDAPGPRDMLRQLRAPSMVPAGDREAFAEKILDVLGLPLTAYEGWCADSERVARLFSWSVLARETLETYQTRLSLLAGVEH